MHIVHMMTSGRLERSELNFGLFSIMYSREMFNKWQAQRWWAENYDKVMELYNVQRFNRQAFPLPTPPRSEDEVIWVAYTHVKTYTIY